MLEKFKQDITIDKLREDVEKIPKYKEAEKPNSYLISYPEFLKFFSEKNEITKHDLIIGIHFIYGWMPTIFEFCTNEIDNPKQILEIINRAKNGAIPKEDELKVLKTCFNNSLVGTCF